MEAEPFFILGCVRSGTTMLRNILRCHPNLICPEETHFFRWSEPFGTFRYKNSLLSGSVLKKHRALDGISEDEFLELLSVSTSRSDLYKKYMQLFVSKATSSPKRWFDKTPQNIFCGALLCSQFPKSKLIHIVRSPLDVICSLRIGRVMKEDSLVGACNYWLESVQVFDTLKRAESDRVLEVRYQDFTDNAEYELDEIINFVGEQHVSGLLNNLSIKPKTYEYEEYLSPKEIDLVRTICGEWMDSYSFSFCKG